MLETPFAWLFGEGAETARTVKVATAAGPRPVQRGRQGATSEGARGVGARRVQGRRRQQAVRGEGEGRRAARPRSTWSSAATLPRCRGAARSSSCTRGSRARSRRSCSASSRRPSASTSPSRVAPAAGVPPRVPARRCSCTSRCARGEVARGRRRVRALGRDVARGRGAAPRAPALLLRRAYLR